MTDADLLQAAIDAAADGNQSEFARLVGHAQPSNVGQRLRGKVGITELERRLYRVIVDHPNVAKWMGEAAAAMK